MYSLGQPNTQDGPTLGTPNTFMFAFAGVGGDPIFAPNAVDDTLTTPEDTSGMVNVLANDTDPDGDPLTVTEWTQGMHGTVSCTAAGQCTYTPTADFFGSDSFTYTISDGTGGTDTATVHVTVTPVAEANLSITKTDAPDPITVGQNLTYTITVGNALGPDAASGVVVSDTLPAGVSSVSATPSQGGPCTGTTTISCPLGTIASPGSVTRTIVVTPTVANPALSNTATVAATTADPCPATTAPRPRRRSTRAGSANLALTKTDSPDPVLVGGNLTYTLTVTNSGPDAAAGVTITDTLPTGVSFVSASAGCTNASGTVTCTIGALANGANAVRTIMVSPTVANPSLSNTATRRRRPADPNPGNNSATATTT